MAFFIVALNLLGLVFCYAGNEVLSGILFGLSFLMLTPYVEKAFWKYVMGPSVNASVMQHRVASVFVSAFFMGCLYLVIYKKCGRVYVPFVVLCDAVCFLTEYVSEKKKSSGAACLASVAELLISAVYVIL
ncbi:MAG: hypothetical protein J5738_01020 [Lachnospiraceae bacterium]|nr:hypothetical protein [Lachnospiraceae bacterium]